MRILIIGGTRFTGPFVARQLIARGHEVTVYHRGQRAAEVPAEVKRIQGDRHDPASFPALRDLRPEVVIDMIAHTREEAESLVATFRGVARRVVVPSSEDVYRAYGRLHRTEPGPPDPMPLTEDSPLREKPSIHGPTREKLHVEQVVMSQPELPGTILRLPAIYGPGDHRMYELIRPMLDGRPAIVFADDYAAWRWTHGYVENVAHAIVLAATDDRARNRIYNVGESATPRQIHRAGHIADAAGWRGRLIALPADGLPDRFERLDWSQDWETDSRRIRIELGYDEIIDYQTGLGRTVDWQRDHPNEKLAPTPQQYAEDDALLARHRAGA
jgi:nucleoside-diphosphate-sugar epimerase